MADRDVRVRLSASVSQYVAGMTAASAATDKVAASGINLSKLGGQLQSFGRTATLGLTAPMTAAGVVAVGMARNYETSFSRMKGLAGVPAAEIDGLRQSVLALAKETGRAPTELADALYTLRSSGLDANEAMQALEMSAKASASGLGSTATVADAVSSAMNAYAASGLTASEATDILVATAREGKAEPAELAASMGRVLPIASQLGVSFDQVGGAIAQFSLTGQDAAGAVTTLENVLNKLLRPSQQSREALAGIGMSVNDLQSHLSTNGLLSTLDMLRTKLGDNGFVTFMDDAQALRGALALTGDNAQAAADTFEGVKDSVGSLATAFSAWLESDGADIAKAFAEIQAAMIEFGNAILPVAADVATGLGKIASAFASLPEGVQMAIAGVLIAVGPLAMVAGTVVKNVAIIRAALAGLPGVPGGAPLLPLVAAGVGLDYVLGQVYSPNNWTGGRDTTPDRPAPPRQVGNWATDAQMAQAGAWGITTGDWMFGGGGTPFFSTGALTTPRPAPPPGPPSINPPRGWDDTYRRAGPPTFGPPPSFDMGLADAFAESAANLARLTEITRQYALVTASTDWGAAGFNAANVAMREFTSESFGLANIAMAAEEAFGRLDEAVEKNGFTLDIATEAGRENMVALQGVAATLDTQFVSAYADANGSLDTFMATATTIGNETLKRLQTELGLSDEETAALAETLNLTAKDYEARWKLTGDEEAQIKLGLLSGTIGLLQEDVQREVAMRIATGDFQGALDLVQENIAETERNPKVTVSVEDRASKKLAEIQSQVDNMRGKTLTITTQQITTYGTKNLGDLSKHALGGRVGPNGGIGGEAGLEYVDIGGFGAFIDRPTLLPPGAMVTPLSAGGGGGGSGGSFSGGGGTSINLVVNAGLGTDGYHVGRQIVDALARHTRINGPGGMQRIVAA